MKLKALSSLLALGSTVLVSQFLVQVGCTASSILAGAGDGDIKDSAADGADNADARAHTHGDFEPNPSHQQPKPRQRHSMRQDTQQQQQQQEQDSHPGSPSTTRQKFRDSANWKPHYVLPPNNSTSSTESAKSRAGANCQRLEVDETLVYPQLEAEGSNNDLLKKVNGIINSKLEGVTSVSVILRGEGINRKVGNFEAKAVITRISPSGEDVEQCYFIPYAIRDSDECSLPEGHEMRHKCHRSTVCVNTLGSYECTCADGYWGEEGSGSPSLDKPIKSEDGDCGGASSTEDCCGMFGDRKERREACREDFRCTSDPCKGHTCDENAWCSAESGYKGYSCICKDGYKMDDRGDCVRDVQIAVNHCRNNTCPYHCRCSVEDDGYRCEPRQGYKAYEDDETVPSDYYLNGQGGKRLDKITQCVDKRTPDITIKGANPITYRQGDTYEEQGVTVTDKNEDESTRTVKIEYSEPFGGYFKSTGEFTVRYSLENRLLSGGRLSKIRTVHVVDVDECAYAGPHAEFRHACSPEATCHNTDGSYECFCAEGYAGDGMITGTGCVDVTPPTISCVGLGCKTAKFRACNCVGMVSEDGSRRYLPENLDDSAIEANIKLLKGDICGYGARGREVSPTTATNDDDERNRGLSREQDGVEHDDREWKPEVCFRAIDVLHGGKVVDLSKNITRGQLEKHPEKDRTWRVPHYVQDEAGNAAAVQYFDIAVEEVDVLNTIYGTAETLQRDSLERRLLWAAVCVLSVLLLLPILWRVMTFLRTVLAAARVVFFPYAMVGSREDFKLGYGFLLRVKSMGMGTEIERERKIASYWASLMDEADMGDEGRDEDD